MIFRTSPNPECSFWLNNGNPICSQSNISQDLCMTVLHFRCKTFWKIIILMSLSSFKNEFSKLMENIAKGTTDPRVKFCLPKFKQIQTQILIKFYIQNLNQALTSKSQPNISISSQTNCREISDGVSESVSNKGSQCRQLNQFFFSNVKNLFTIQTLPELQL